MKSILYQEYLAYLVGLALSFSAAIHYFDELSIIWKRDLIGKLTHPKEPIPNISIYMLGNERQKVAKAIPIQASEKEDKGFAEKDP